jgi:hypothetical protein
VKSAFAVTCKDPRPKTEDPMSSYHSISSGNFTDPAIWLDGSGNHGVPGLTDDWTVSAGHAVNHNGILQNGACRAAYSGQVTINGQLKVLEGRQLTFLALSGVGPQGFLDVYVQDSGSVTIDGCVNVSVSGRLGTNGRFPTQELGLSIVNGACLQIYDGAQLDNLHLWYVDYQSAVIPVNPGDAIQLLSTVGAPIAGVEEYPWPSFHAVVGRPLGGLLLALDNPQSLPAIVVSRNGEPADDTRAILTVLETTAYCHYGVSVPLSADNWRAGDTLHLLLAYNDLADQAGHWRQGLFVIDAATANVRLTPDGLDAVAIAAPAGPATTLRAMIVQLWRRFFAKALHDKTAGRIQTFADDGLTVLTTQEVGEDPRAETQGAAT